MGEYVAADMDLGDQVPTHMARFAYLHGAERQGLAP